MFDKDMMRAFFPSSEAIIFGEPFGSESYAIGDIGDHYFQPIQQVLDMARNGKSIKELAIESGLPESQLSHYFRRSATGWRLPSQQSIDALGLPFNEKDLLYWRDNLRIELEKKRRPFNVTADVPYTDVWDFPTVNTYPGKHPAEKPLAMMRHIVTASSRPGDLVVDPFCGSGTTLAAARIEGRHYIGADMDAHWAHVARRKVRDAGLDMAEPVDATKTGQLVGLPLFAEVC